MSSINISTLRSVYITNEPYQYPMPYYQKSSSKEAPGSFLPLIYTGWHIIPNVLWGHMCSPKQWWEMVIQYEAIKVNSIHCRLFNPIPIQTAVSFQGTGTFPAFNNTVYALAYKDEIYETPWFDWWSKPFINKNKEKADLYYEYNPAFKEGLIQKPIAGVGYTLANEAADDRGTYDSDWNTTKYPRSWTTKTWQASSNNLQESNKYRRQFLPIYWYNFPFKQYRNVGNATASWLQLDTDFEYAYNDISGAFWDPLNRPDELMELRPGKNMIEFNWSVADVDSNIWFNTDRIASLTPYGRPRPLNVDPGYWNMPLKVRPIDPRGPGNKTNKYEYLKTFGIIKQGDPLTTPIVQMAPEKGMSLVDWRRWPVVPSRWFYEELRQSNPWAYQNVYTQSYAKEANVCGATTASAGINQASATGGDVQSSIPFQDIKFAGTEYEQHKYPPSQWFIKAIPLFDDGENRIPVEMQMFMHITINLTGKPRKSALYSPSWGPIVPMDLYSVNMDTNFGENYMRVRSGGARRTYYDPQDGLPMMVPEPPNPPGQIYQDNSSQISDATVPYDIKKVCVISTEGKTAPTIPIDSIYNNTNKKPSVLVTISGDSRSVLEQENSDDFEVL